MNWIDINEVDEPVVNVTQGSNGRVEMEVSNV